MSAAAPTRLASFPAGQPGQMETPALLAARGFQLRALHDDDLPWLRDLYASTRAEELAPVPWPEIVKRNFLDQQFALQHQHFLTYYGEADFLAIEQGDKGPRGRFYLLRAAPAYLLVDICLFPGDRGHGLGSLLIRHSQQAALAAGCAMELHVLRANHQARRLYERLGFVEVDASTSTESHLKMRWQAAPSAA